MNINSILQFNEWLIYRPQTAEGYRKHLTEVDNSFELIILNNSSNFVSFPRIYQDRPMILGLLSTAVGTTFKIFRYSYFFP